MAVAFLPLLLLLGTSKGERLVHDLGPSQPTKELGRKWHVQLVPDDFCQNGANRNCDGSKLKILNGKPHMFYTEFLDMAQQSPEGRILGPVNGWGALINLTVQTITCVGHHGVKYLYERTHHHPADLLASWRQIFGGGAKSNCKSPLSIRSSMLSPSWSNLGWAPTSPGFTISFQPFHSLGPRVTYGNDMAKDSQEGRAVQVHLFSHRYAKETESWKDMLTWHSGILLEWDHGRYATVIELAWLDGLGGYKGRSNWYDDKLSRNGTLLYNSMPSGMKEPWDSSRNEIRMLDVEPNGVEAFATYLKKYSDAGELPQDQQRFLEPKFPLDSGAVRLYRATRGDIGRYLVNYNLAIPEYNELTMNCQIFAADLFSFLTGKPAGVTTSFLKLTYHPHPKIFQKEPDLPIESLSA